MLVMRTLCSKGIEMATYLVSFSGKNFLIAGDEDMSKRRFRSTRLVEAEDQKHAETIARKFILKDPRLQDSVLNEESDPPEIHLESVIEVPAMSYDAQNRANSIHWESEE